VGSAHYLARQVEKSEFLMIQFDKVESSILATLEEAGEDGIAALLNTVNAAHAHGSARKSIPFVQH
jgi:hypothetical protein